MINDIKRKSSRRFENYHCIWTTFIRIVINWYHSKGVGKPLYNPGLIVTSYDFGSQVYIQRIRDKREEQNMNPLCITYAISSRTLSFLNERFYGDTFFISIWIETRGHIKALQQVMRIFIRGSNNHAQTLHIYGWVFIVRVLQHWKFWFLLIFWNIVFLRI